MSEDIGLDERLTEHMPVKWDGISPYWLYMCDTRGVSPEEAKSLAPQIKDTILNHYNDPFYNQTLRQNLRRALQDGIPLTEAMPAYVSADERSLKGVDSPRYIHTLSSHVEADGIHLRLAGSEKLFDLKVEEPES